VRAGLWHPSEYEGLPKYDGNMSEQAAEGATQLQMCRQGLGSLCAGWLLCHRPKNLLALRLNDVDPSTWKYQSTVPVWGSGAEAAAHGLEKHPRSKL
jgi:hypothetical protein